MSEPPAACSGWSSLREIDEAAGAPKGSAFRAFKRLLPELVEGRDFLVAAAATHADLRARLLSSGRVYRNSVNPVLLAPAAAGRVRIACAGDAVYDATSKLE
jgi:hypothetical protein